MQHLEQFHREAVNKNLSAGAILLWQQLYFTMERKNQFADLPLNTAVLTAQLKVSRQGLALMRQALADNGLLAVRVDEHQQTFYTLMLNGKAVEEGANIQTENTVGAVDHNGPFQNKNLPSANGRMWSSAPTTIDSCVFAEVEPARTSAPNHALNRGKKQTHCRNLSPRAETYRF